LTLATILIVDDRRLNRDYLAAILENAGHRLLQAADGAEALGMLRSERPDLVVSDILMPTMDGYELLRKLRGDPAISQTPVIFYTAHYHEKESLALARAWGVASVLTKGCEPRDVLNCVQAALKRETPAPAPPAAEDFDREHMRLLTDKLSQKADELRTANERLTALINLGLEFGSERDPCRLLQSFCHAAREIIGARYAMAGVLDGDGVRLRYFFTSGMDAETAARVGSPDPQRGGSGTVLRESRCLRLHNPSGNPAAVDFPSSHPPFHAWLGAPIVSPGRVYGWVGLLDKVGAEAFTDEDERLASILTALVGRIYENGSLYADVLIHSAELEQEVVERKRAEEALRESEEHSRLLLNSTAEAIYRIDLEGRCTFCNPACLRMLGYAEGRQLLGKNMHALIHHTRADGSPYPPEECRIFQAIRGGEGAHVEDEVLWRADGLSFPAEYWSYPILREGRIVGSVVTFLDITDRRRLEEQFRQAQKMEAVGRLAGGVAHDFNNLLTIINGYGEMVLSGLPPDDPHRELIREMVAAGDRAAALTRQLLAFSRKAIIEPKILDLKAVVADVDKMLRRVIGEDVQLAVLIDPEVGAVKADPGQVDQVILNLVVNARDAMPQGGKLTIELSNTELDETYALGRPEARPGPHVLLAVSDTGCGMDQATRARIFEPFFSTKGDKGTGLGLATVHGIVKQSGGHVAVYSEVGHGTSFKVYLPRLKHLPAPGKSHQGQAELLRGSETVLLVEDEDGVRALSRHVLQGCGYTVLEARDGVEAVRVAGRHRGRIDLLLTDVVMPRMSGREVAERLAGRHAGMKVLFLSGYTEDAVVRHGILEAEVAFLQKPFSPASLAAKVREVLDGA
jgi:PAS domain S-box-containing protein